MEKIGNGEHRGIESIATATDIYIYIQTRHNSLKERQGNNKSVHLKLNNQQARA